VDTPVVESTPTETPAPPVEDTSSIADHEAQFGPAAKRQAKDPAETPREPSVAKSTTPRADEELARQAREDGERDEKGQFKPRAEKQKASREDVPRIQELTRKLRDAERERDEWRQRSTAPARETAPLTVAAQPFMKPEPKKEDFAMSDDPIADWMDARQDWRLEKKFHEAQQSIATKQQAESQRAALEHGNALKAQVEANIAEFKKSHPDYDEVLEAVEDLKYPDNLGHVIVTSDNPAKIAYYLGTHVDDYVAAIGFAASLDMSESSVALLRRYLNRYSRATDAPPNGATGAPKPAPSVIVAPKPPTPVRTGPLKTGDEPPGDNDMSLANHEKFYGRKRR